MSEAVAAGEVRKVRATRIDPQFVVLASFYTVLVIAFSLATPNFMSWSNGVNILSNVTVLGFVALGQTLAIVSGGFDLSVPLGAVAYVILTNAGGDMGKSW